MSRGLCATFVVLGFIAAGAASVFGDGTVLFEEDFEGDLSKWDAPATWKVEDGRLVVNRGGIALCRVGREWTDIVLEFDTTILRETSEWVYRAKSPSDCMFMQLAGPRAKYLPGYLRGHTFIAGKNQAVLEVPLPFEPAERRSYHVRVEMVGSTIHTFVEGRWVHAETAARFLKGTIGFRGAGTGPAATFDNVVVRKLDTLSPVPKPGISTRTPRPDRYLRPTLGAKWIWLPGAGLDRWFRKRFVLAGKPLRARTVVAADNAFELYVNGRRAAAGESWEHLEVLDLAAELHPGQNVLAVHARNFEPGAAGLLIECGVVMPGGGHLRVASDATWRASRTESAGWRTRDFDDASWARPSVIGSAVTSPWGRVSKLWRVPYMGPCQMLRLVRTGLPAALAAGKPSSVRLVLDVPEPLADDYPVVVSLAGPEGHVVELASFYPDEPTSEWGRGERTLEIPLRPRRSLYLPAGTYKLTCEMPGTILANAADGRLGALAVAPIGFRRGAVPLEKRRTAPGLFTDAEGFRHGWQLTSDGLVYDGQKLVPVRGTDGVFWCEWNAGDARALEALCDDEALARVAEGGLTREPVRCRLTDHIDCGREPAGDVPDNTSPHQFSEDGGYGGKSRVEVIGGKSYRVTAAVPRLSYFAYTVRCNSPGVPHVFCFETPNDIERYTMVRIQPPWDNVGCGTYTGREYPLDGRACVANFIFYPRDRDVRFTVSRTFSERELAAESGAAVSEVWLLELVDELGDRPAEMHLHPELPERRFGIALTHPYYLYQLYGFRPDNPFERARSLRSFIDYARFVGMNYLEFNAVNGSDVSVTAYYDSGYFKQSRDSSGAPCDLLAELPPLAAEARIDVVPCLTSLSFKGDGFKGVPWISDETFQLDADGKTRREFFKHFGEHNKGTPDPLRPEVAKVFLDVISEMAAECKDHEAVKGIAFRVNGKIGTCYTGYSETERAETAGYSSWDIAEFEKDTGIDVPDMKPTPYKWLRENAWEAWIDWRCERMRQLWSKARDIVTASRPDWKLVAKCDLPSETPGRNILWPAGYDTLELLRTYGYDPRLYEDDPAILVQQGFFIGGGRYFHSYGPASSCYRNAEAWKAFDYEPGLWKLYANAAGYSCEFYHVYWEEFGVSPMGEFRTGFWGAGKMSPPGRHFLEPLTYALRTGNAHTLVMFSWERGTQGNEARLRRFVRAYRALPAVAGKAFGGNVDRLDEGSMRQRLWLRWFADRLAVLNDSPEAFRLRVTIPKGKATGNCLVDYATQRVLWTGHPGDDVTVELEMEPYDLRALSFRER